MNTDIDLNFRPVTYFKPQRLEKHLLSKVKGGVVKQYLQSLLREGRISEATDLLCAQGIHQEDVKMLESFHPMFMGGNYLPNIENGEVEIGRIQIKSTTYDVTSVYARLNKGVIKYRVVDEYNGDTLTGKAKRSSKQPLTLAEFADFFLNAWPLMEVLKMNFEDDLDESLDFFSADSDFYPDFDKLCRQRVIDYFTNCPDVGLP